MVKKAVGKRTKRTVKQSGKRRLLTQLVGYSLSGSARFWSGYGAFFVFDQIFGWPFVVSKQLANVLGLLVEFVLNRYFVFKGLADRSTMTKVSFRFVVVTLVNFAIDYLIVWGLKQAGVSPYIGQFVSAGFFWGWNFLWYRFWVFTGSGSRSD